MLALRELLELCVGLKEVVAYCDEDADCESVSEADWLALWDWLEEVDCDLEAVSDEE